MRKSILLVVIGPLFSGCVAHAAWDVATAPVRATSQVVDWTTTSQSEADRNYGRKMRKEEARRGKELRNAEDRCQRDPDDSAACEMVQRDLAAAPHS